MQLALVVVIVVVSMAGREASSKDKDYDALWNQWKQDFGKDFASEEEEAKALKNFLDHDKEIDLRNGLYEMGLSHWTAGHNSFSHLSHEDLKSRTVHINVDSNDLTKRDLYGAFIFRRPDGNGNYVPYDDWVPTPIYYIYRANSSVQILDANYKTILSEPVQDQGTCGANYAFAGCSVMASYLEKFQSNIVNVSRQEIIDCSSYYGNNGCSWGYAGWALAYIAVNGISSAEQYPYKATSQSCQSKSDTYKIDYSKYQLTQISTDPLSLKSALKTCGALSITLYADSAFNFYKSGIYSCCKSGTNNHVVTLIGWGTTADGDNYWILKNSWGTSFGDKGYFKLAFSSCGIDSSRESNSWGFCPNTV